MIKKGFTAFAALLLMSNNLNAYAVSDDPSFNYDHCNYSADLMYTIAVVSGFNHSQAYDMSVNSFNSCVDNVNIEAANYWNYN